MLGDVNAVTHLFELGANMWTECLEIACDCKHIDLVKAIMGILLSKPEVCDWTIILSNVSILDDKKYMAQALGQLKAEGKKPDWNKVLCKSIRYNNPKMAKLATDYLNKEDIDTDWLTLLPSACDSKNEKVVNECIHNIIHDEYGINVEDDVNQVDPCEFENVLNGCLDDAFEANSASIVDLLIKHGASISSHCFYYAYAFNNTTLINKLEVVLQSIKSPSGKQKCVREAFLGACYGGHINLARQMLNKCKAINADVTWQDGFHLACIGGHRGMIDSIMSRLDLRDQDVWHGGFISACEGGNTKILKLFYPHIVGHFEDGIGAAIERGELPVLVDIFKHTTLQSCQTGLGQAITESK